MSDLRLAGQKSRVFVTTSASQSPGTAACVSLNGSVRQSRKLPVRCKSKICVRTVMERLPISAQINSSSSTTRWIARFVTKAVSVICKTKPWAMVVTPLVLKRIRNHDLS